VLPERARDLERLSRKDRSELDPTELLAMLGCEDWTVRMHLCRMLSRVEWSAEQYPEVLQFVLRQVKDKNTFVRAWALDALGWLAATDKSIRLEVYQLLEDAISSGPPSIKVRARESLKRLMG
jgi:hypothetical protein